jgi:methionyl aminopeptidase
MMEAPAIHTGSFAASMEKPSRIVAETISLVGKHIAPGITTLQLDAIAEDYILSKGGQPAFKGYVVDRKTFRHSLCISVNEEVVHGIPSERILDEGDIVSIDCGVKFDGYFGDSAFTFPVGSISEDKQKLLKATQEALMLGVEQAIARNKVYDVARAIQTHVEKNGFSIVRELVGHGIGKRLHEDPAMPNFVPPLLQRSRYPNEKFQRGQAIAIEPMVNAGTHQVRTLSDGWTVITADKKASAHFEHTVLIEEGRPVILTLMD